MKGKKLERKKTTLKQDNQRSSVPQSHRSRYVGVYWVRSRSEWEAAIRADNKYRHIGYSHDEKETARMYDEQAALLDRPVNFPLHEGMKQAVKRAPKRKDRSKMPNVNRPSKYVGVAWCKQHKMWKAMIKVSGKLHSLGQNLNEKEAARMYDDQAIILGRPVNFPLHEGMEQAVKAAPHRKDLSKVPNPNRPSKYVGVTWDSAKKTWQAQIKVDGKSRFLGCYRDEKEAARNFDEQAIILGRAVNFPLHEGHKQAVKSVPRGSRKKS